jgi:tRNA-2-methylthio-N6-dimethylallyladenosine synthase
MLSVHFAELISMIERVDGLERIRFMTSHPKDLSDELISLYAVGEKKLCPSIHLPVQTGSSRLLSLMNRKYTKEDYLLLVEKLRAADPDIVITTDLIVGFPGETEEDFSETMDLIERVRYDSAFTFLFSPRRGTPAAGMDDQIPEAVKHERFDRMVKRLNEITLEKNKEYVGRVFDVLFDGPAKSGDSVMAGRTPGGKLVNVAGTGGIAAGDLRRVKITGVNTFSFTGELDG